MFKKILINFWPLLFIITIWFIFSSPFFLQNKVPFASTYLVNFFSPWNAYPGFSSPVKNNAMPDVITQIYPWKTFTIDSFKDFVLPLWNPYSFSGTLHLANYQSAILSPLNLLFFILPFIDAWSLLILLQPLLAGIFMYLFLRSIKIKSISSLCGAVSFMFCGFITTWMGYGTLGFAILFLPLALYFLEKFYLSGKFKYLFLLSLTFPLSFFSGHFQISLYFLLFIFGYIFYKFLETKEKSKTLYSFIYLGFGILLTAPQVLPSIEAYMQSFRSSIFQKIEVIPWGYLSTLLAPDYLGNPVTRNDWFGHYAEWNGFIGTISILFSLYSLFYAKNKKVIFFLIALIVSLLLSFQSPLADLVVFLKIPVLSTSAASRVIVLFSFSAAVLCALGIDFLIADLNKRDFKKLLFWAAISITAFITLWAVVIFKFFMPLDKIIIAKQNLLLPSLLLFVLFGCLLISFFIIKFKRESKILAILPFVFLILITFDLLRFSTKWQEFGSKYLVYPKVSVASEFNKIKSVDRVFGNLGGEATIYYKLPSVEGYDAVYIKRYGEFISSLDNGQIGESARSVVSFPKHGLYSQAALDLLGVKYLVHKISDGRSSWTYPFWTFPDNYRLLYGDSAYQIFENTKAYPRAFLANSYLVANNSQDTISKMFSDSTNLRNTVVLEKDPKTNLDMKFGSVSIVKYTPEKVNINTDTDGKSVLFLSDTYYPGWKAFVDGKETPLYRADYTFRAIILGKGKHTVSFIYDPNSFKWGILIALIGLVLMIVFLVRGRTISFPKA